VRKLGVPGHEEFAMGAIGSGGACVLNSLVIDVLHISRADVDDVAERERQELNRREHLYRDSRPYPRPSTPRSAARPPGSSSSSRLSAARRTS
jgi:putative phosphoribosyl transferase